MVREVQLGNPMALREFEAADGTRWRVWETIPGRTEGLGPDFRRGWLTFDNGAERRRFAPVPSAWVEMPSDRLELLLRAAHAVGSGDPNLGGFVVDRRVGERRRAERRHGDRRQDGSPGTRSDSERRGL